MEIDEDLLARFGMDQETFDRLRKTSPTGRAYTMEEYRQLDQDELLADQCRDQLSRSMETRINNGFYHLHKAVLDDLPYRVFQTMAEYRRWCHENLPAHLGYRLVSAPPANHA